MSENMRKIAAEDLLIGDMVDLEGDKFVSKTLQAANDSEDTSPKP
jgi:hypothetical protein